VWSLLKDTAANWSKHKAARLGAALAYYSIFSLGPLLGDTGAQAVNAMLLGASQPREGILQRSSASAP